MYVFFIVFFSVFCSRPDGDHQNTTYYGRFEKKILNDYGVKLTPFFSPDHSTALITNMIVDSKYTVDIAMPSIKSWIGCSHGEKCIGCNATKLKFYEKSSFFQAILDAVYQGRVVRILTNDFEQPPVCDYMLDIPMFLQIAGADVQRFTTLSTMHSKYVMVDGYKMVLTSVNPSDSGFLENREAGVYIEEYNDEKSIIDYYKDVFEFDFKQAYIKKIPQLHESDVKVITNKSLVPIVIPPVDHFKCNITSPDPTLIQSKFDIELFVSPEYAFEEITADLNKTKDSLYAYLYEITDDRMCDKLIELHSKSVDIHLLVSTNINSITEEQVATQCYKKLLSKGIKTRMVDNGHGCTLYNHQKYWIMDGENAVVATGNWAEEDLSGLPYEYPPYGKSGWRETNRDYNIKIFGNLDVVSRLMEVFQLDYEQGHDFTP